MKTFLLKHPKRILAIASLAGICGLFTNNASAQNIGRIYANYQNYSADDGLLEHSDVTSPGNAITTSTLEDYSTPNITLGILGTTVRQYLEFRDANGDPMNLPAGTVVHIKVGVSAGLLGLNLGSLLGATTFGTFTNLSGADGDATATIVAGPTTGGSNNTLVDLLSGAGTDELMLTTTAASNGVYMELKAPVAGVVYSGDLFHAYIFGDVGASGECPKVVDWTYNTAKSPLATAVGDLSTIADATNAFDGDQATAATLSPVNVLNKTVFNLTLNTPAKVGDSIRISMNNPNGGLLDLAALHGLVIKAYDGPDQVGGNIDESSSLLTLRLLPGSTDKNIITAAVEATGTQTSTTFDRISLEVGGVADVSSLLGSGDIAIYEAGVVVPAPAPVNDITKINAYKGNTINLNTLVAANTNNDAIIWYDAAEGGNVVDPSVTVSGNVTYYAASQRNGCTDASDRTEIVINVASITNTAPEAAHVGEAYSGDLTVSLDPSSELPNVPNYTLSNIVGVFTPADGSAAIKFNIDANAFNRYAMAKMPAIFAAGPSTGLIAQFAETSIGNGLTMDETGHITGTPEAEGSIAIQADVYDEANQLDAGQINSTLAIGAALPVEMSDLHLTLDNDKNVVVSWTTESESGSIRFDVLRSNDGVNFEKIGSVKAAGVSTHAINYSFTDNNPGAKSYYKLDIVKNDGVKTSRIVSISGGKVAGFSINPSPATNNITISGISADNIQAVNIYDAAGRLVSQANTNRVNVQNLAQGIYFVTVVTKDGNTSKAKFIKK